MTSILAQANADVRLDAHLVDYLLVAFYFLLVLGIGYMARRSVSSSLDFLLSGRSMPPGSPASRSSPRTSARSSSSA